MPRALAPDDLYKLRIPTDPRLSPDGSPRPRHAPDVGARKATATATRSGSCRSIEAAASARQLTLGARNDSSPRWSPDGRSIAFLSDRRHIVEEEPDAPDKKDREDGSQVHLLSLDGGEARRLTDLPRGVGGFEWSPDGSKTRRDVDVPPRQPQGRPPGARARPEARSPTDPPESDYRYIDRLGYMFNGPGFIYDQVAHLWIVDVATGEATRLTDGPTSDEDPAWSPDGTQDRLRDAAAAATTTWLPVRHRRDRRRHRAADADHERPASRSSSCRRGCPTARRSPRSAAGCRRTATATTSGCSRPTASEATPNGGRNLSDRHDIMPGSAMNSDITPGEGSRLMPSADGALAVVPRPEGRRPTSCGGSRRPTARSSS